MTVRTEQEMPVKRSKQIGEVGKWWLKSVAASKEHRSLDEVRDFNENWESLTAEPGGVDYIETDAGGVPAMWAIPKGCTEDRVLLCLHGGGFFSGSMYTHRKMFGHFAKEVGCRALIIHYRRSPEHIHPAQVNDAVTAYQWLLEQYQLTETRFNEIKGHAACSTHVTGTVEKCDFCPSKAANNELPDCVKACPNGVFYFGDENEDVVSNGDETVRLSQLLKDKSGYRYLEDLGTKPRVYYLPPVDRQFPFKDAEPATTT